MDLELIFNEDGSLQGIKDSVGEHNLNDDGIIVDDKGNVLYDKDRLDNLVSEHNKLKDEDFVEIGEEKFKVSETGDILLEDGTVKYTKDQYAGLQDGSLVAIVQDDKEVVYKLDESGNAVNEEGAVVFTKEQLEGSGDEDTTFEDLRSAINIVPKDEQGVDISYDNSEDPIGDYVRDAIRVTEETAKAKALEDLYNAYPQLKVAQQYIDLNGSLQGYNAAPKYADFELDESNESQIQQLIIADRIARGDSEADASDYYAYIKHRSEKDKDVAVNAAKKSLENLQKLDNDRIAAIDKQHAEAQAAQVEADKKYWGIEIKDGKIVDLNADGSVYSTVKSGVLKDGDVTYKIPEQIRRTVDGKEQLVKREDFMNYMYRPLKFKLEDGQEVTATQHEYEKYLKDSKRTTDQDILDAYRMYTNYDDRQLLKDKVNQKDVKSKTDKKVRVINVPKVNNNSKIVKINIGG